MKDYERQLMNHFQSGVDIGEEPLHNVRNAMGSLRHVVGNPLFKSEININVTKNYFLNGVQILPAALPPQLQVNLPFFIFGLSDSATSYANSRYLFNEFTPWIIPDNLGYRLSPELFPLVAALIPAWWDGGFGAGWAVFGIAFRFNIAPGNGQMIRNNFWKAGAKYQILWNNLFNPSPNATTLGQNTFISNTAFSIIMAQSAGRILTNLITVPAGGGGTTNLIVDASTDVAGQVNWLNIFSIKEIFGDDIFSGDPAFGIYGYTKTNALSNNVARGDGIFTYTFNGIPTVIGGTYCTENRYVCEIIIHCNNIPYGTFLTSLANEILVVNQMRYNIPPANINQFNNALIFMYQSLFGKLTSDSIDPNMYTKPDDFQNQICDIPVKFPIDKNICIGNYMDVNCNNLSFTIFVEKVESLIQKIK